MAPWDELAYLETYAFSNFVVNGGTVKFKVADSNPRRVAIRFQGDSNGLFVLFPEYTTAGGVFILSSSFSPLDFYHKDLPGLAQAKWFVTNTDGVNAHSINVLEVIMKEWPPEMEKHAAVDNTVRQKSAPGVPLARIVIPKAASIADFPADDGLRNLAGFLKRGGR